MTQTFKINKHITIECREYSTRYSWGHYADLYIDGQYIGEKKCTYYNRTWESYTFQSALFLVIEKFAKHFTKRQITYCNKWIKSGKREANDPGLKSLKFIAGIAKLGAVFATTTKEKNDWATRILKAGLQDKGLIIPEDWDTLSEEEKDKRLTGALSVLA